MIEAIHHVQITVPEESLEAARDFYSGFLGLQEIEKPSSLKKNGGFWLEAGALQVHIGKEENVDRWATKAHVAYRVRGLEEWRKKLLARGLEPKSGSPIPGYARFEFRDPFGNRVEFLESV
jgi:catechol 2,3-dioxygenase-like lactoylglutathione lyase family enzyme